MRITLCNYKNGLLTSFSLGGASTLAERWKVFFISRRTRVKGRRIIAFIFVFILNGAPNQIRTDDLILTMDALYQLSYGSIKNGGARRDRTDDLLNANQALFQLSYGPIKIHNIGFISSSLIRSILLSFSRTALHTRISTVSFANTIF